MMKQLIIKVRVEPIHVITINLLTTSHNFVLYCVPVSSSSELSSFSRKLTFVKVILLLNKQSSSRFVEFRTITSETVFSAFFGFLLCFTGIDITGGYAGGGIDHSLLLLFSKCLSGSSFSLASKSLSSLSNRLS